MLSRPRETRDAPKQQTRVLSPLLWSSLPGLGQGSSFHGCVADAGGAPNPLGMTGEDRPPPEDRVDTDTAQILVLVTLHICVDTQGSLGPQVAPSESSVVLEDHCWSPRVMSEPLIPDARHAEGPFPEKY